MDLDWKDKFKDCYSKIQKIGELYAEAKGQSWQSQELKGSVWASTFLAFRTQSPKAKISELEKETDASHDYSEYIKQTAELMKKELRLKAQYEAEKARFEAYRSLSSLEKRTRTLIDGD